MTALLMSLTVVNTDNYKNASYYRYARQELSWIVSDPHPKQAIQAGWATLRVMPPVAALTRSKKGPLPVNPDSVATRVIVLDNGSTRAALITVDLPMMPPVIAQELKKRLPEFGFNWKNIYLGASPSYPAVGGWAPDYMGQRTFGEYNQEWVNQLTQTILQTVTRAKQTMALVQIGSSQLTVDGQDGLVSVGNQVTSQALQFLKLQKQNGESALIYSVSNPPVSLTKNAAIVETESFLGHLNQQMESQIPCFSMRLVGSIQPVKAPIDKVNPTGVEGEQIRMLTSNLVDLVKNQPLHTDSVIIAQTTTLAQENSDPQFRISQHWRLKSWLVRKLYGAYPAELKALRIGDMVFVGLPGEVSSQALPDFLQLPIARQYKLLVTSYNGGNIGQIVPDKYYFQKESSYDIHQINRFGPQTTEFMLEMTQRLASSLK
ncbi:hypothetical protein [Larkinella harenae]